MPLAQGESSVKMAGVQEQQRYHFYDVTIKFDSELGASIKLWVVADRHIDDEREEMEFDNEGNLIEKPREAAQAKA